MNKPQNFKTKNPSKPIHLYFLNTKQERDKLEDFSVQISYKNVCCQATGSTTKTKQQRHRNTTRARY